MAIKSATRLKSRCLARTAVLINGKRNEISAYHQGEGFAAKWRCAQCGNTGAMPTTPRDSILAALVEAKKKVYRHYDRMHE